MNRLVLKYCIRGFSTAKGQLPRTTSLTLANQNVPKLISQLDQVNQQTQLGNHQEFLLQANKEIFANLDISEKGRTRLINSNITSSDEVGLPLLSSGALFAFGLYQATVGSYSYYCFLGTIGVAALIFGKFARKLTPYPYIGNVDLLDNGSIEIDFRLKKKHKSIVVQRNEFAFQGDYVRIRDDKYSIPRNSLINLAKIRELGL